ncbi:helix-turn-helix domain-containing protein [Cronobacter universalis]|nr:helix-turn-helix domain-containing protein [Cronobacter universalis]
MRIALVAVPGSMRSALAGLTDIFWLASHVVMNNPVLNRNADASAPMFSTHIVTADGLPVEDAQGRLIQADAAFSMDKEFDLIVATGMRLDEHRYPVDVEAINVAAKWIKRHHSCGGRVAGVCAGGFILAEAGLLNGRNCATTWWLFHTFRERYPAAKPAWGKTLVEDGTVITSGGPLSWIDLALNVVSAFAGPEAAKLTTDMAIADGQPLSQHLYAPKGFLNSVHPLLMQAEHLVRYGNPSITVEQLAAALNMTTRTLHRKIRDLLHESPKNFIIRVRIEMATRMLEDSAKTVQQIAIECGYSDEGAFRRAFNAVTGMSPMLYKKWFKNRSL